MMKVKTEIPKKLDFNSHIQAEPTFASLSSAEVLEHKTGD